MNFCSENVIDSSIFFFITHFRLYFFWGFQNNSSSWYKYICSMWSFETRKYLIYHWQRYYICSETFWISQKTINILWQRECYCACIDLCSPVDLLNRQRKVIVWPLRLGRIYIFLQEYFCNILLQKPFEIRFSGKN